jgi:uncharacterized protein involved in exopolysaccharide biosynthesis
MQSSDEDDDEHGSAGGFQVELLRSYVAFAARAIRQRRGLTLGVLLVGIGLTVTASIFLPKTYSCTTILMTLNNPVLDGGNNGNPLGGASDLIMRHENLTDLVEATGLIEKSAERRPVLLRLKDRITRALFGELSDKAKLASLVGTLENRISVSTDRGDLSIKVDWSDGVTAAEVAGAARESFLKARRAAEIAAFEEKMSILDGHATKLRADIDTFAQQLQAAREERLGQALGEKGKQKDEEPSSAAPRAAPRMIVAARPAEPDAELPVLSEKLATAKQKLAALESERERQLRDAEAKFAEMKLRLTPNHPEVVTQGERVAMLSQVPSDVALLRAEVTDLGNEIKQREGLARQGSGAVMAMASAAPKSAASNAEPLPAEITELLDKNDLDPALVAQLSSTVMKYGTLRDDLLSARIELDTAQAAFNHRYQLIVPADVPAKPIKPKPAMVIGGGLALALLLALLLPIGFELRTGIMIERWQVHQVQLPVLAELRLPPHSSD